MASKRSHHESEEGPVQPDEGKKAYIIKPRGLNIIWGKDSRYWHLPEPGKQGPAELVQVCWLEVTGSIDLEGDKTYEIGFCISLKEDAFGWSDCPVFLMAKVGKKGRYTRKRLKPLDQTPKGETEIPEDKFRITIPKEGDKKLFFGLYEVWNGKWKGGLQIHHAFIRAVA